MDIERGVANQRISVLTRPNFKLAALGRLGILKEVAIVVGAYLLYLLARHLVAERTQDAMLRAIDIIDLEHRLGLFWELDVQTWALSNHVLAQFFNQVYIWGYLPFLGVVGIWFYLCYRQRYLLYRNAFLLSGAIALVFFVTMPTAPPRFLWWVGFKDTVALMAGGYYEVQSDGFVNRYAAVPSMHFGWVLLIGIAMLTTCRPYPLRAIGVAMPIVMYLSIVATGNHFFLDGIAGGLVSLTGLGLALLLQRGGRYRSRSSKGPAAS